MAIAVAYERPLQDVLHDYARPFLALGQSNGEARDSQAALDYAALIWDLVVDGLTTAEIVALFDEVEPRWAGVVEAFVERKQRFFADDRRYLVASRLGS
jgi:hypothetical protein